MKILETLKVSYNFLRKETLAQVFPCEFYEIFNSNFFIDYLRGTGFLTLIQNYEGLKHSVKGYHVLNTVILQPYQ